MTGKANNFSHTLLTLLLVASFQISNAQEVVLHGNEPAYQGDKITFYTFTDFISQQHKKLCTVQVGTDGSFKCSFSVKTTRKIHTDLGVFDAYLFVEPGKTYHIVLPPKKEKDRAQRLNPYFEPYPYHIGLKNTESKGLNAHIYTFFNQYNHFFNENATRLNHTSRKKDSILQLLNKTTNFDHPFFYILKKYKTKGLQITLNGKRFRLKQALFNDSSIYYNNPAYGELFNTLFQDYFKDFSSSYGFSVFHAINQEKNIPEIDSIMARDSLLEDNPKLRELVMLKGLHDLFYSKEISEGSVIEVIDSFATWTDIEQHRIIAKNIKEKITRLLPGYEAPSFCLYDADSNKVCLNDFRGEYVYLGFCNKLNYSCLKDYKILKNLHKKHKQHFRIVTISTAQSFDQMKQFIEQKQYSWTFLHYGGNTELLKKYNIKTMPTYFFINPEGKLSLSPGPQPSEKIEQEIYKILRSNGFFQQKQKKKLDF